MTIILKIYNLNLQLSSYMKSNFIEAAVVGVGMPHEQVADFASRLNFKPDSSRTDVASKYYPGSDLRKETIDRLAYVALAVQGPS